MYARVANLGNYVHLQTSLGHISTWCDMWQLQISITKCRVLHMGRTNLRFDYEINNITLPTSCCVKELGIQINDTLSFSLQCSSMVSKARSRCALFLRFFVCRDPTLMINFFRVYVRPLMEYGNNIWSPIKVNEYKLTK